MNGTESRLIDLIYAALFGETSWDVFMEHLADTPGDGKVTLISHDAFRNEGWFSHYYKCNDTLVSDYESYYADVNPWVPHCVARPEGYAAVGDEMVPRERFIQTEYFNDFLVPHDIRDGAGISIVKNGNRTVMLSVFSATADQAVTARMAERLAVLYPHLRRAADYYRRGERQESTLGFGKALVDAVDIGLVVVGEDLRPKTISDSAMSMMAGGSELSVSPIGRLRINNELAQKQLIEMLRLGYQGQKTADFMVGGFKLTLVHVEKDRISQFFEGPTVAIMMEPVGGVFDPEFFAAAYRLTRAETRALGGIVAGKPIDAIAAEAGVSRETIRSQMKSLFLKTGVHSQNGLLRLVYTPHGKIRSS